MHRGLREAAPLLDAVFRGYGVPVALTRIVPAGHTALGRGLLALAALRARRRQRRRPARVAAHPGPARARARCADASRHARARRASATPTARAAPGSRSTGRSTRSTACARPHERGPARAVRAARRRGPGDCSPRRFAGRRRCSTVPSWPTRAPPPRCAARCASWAGWSRALVPGPAELGRVLGGLDVRLGDPPGPGRVTIADPLALRARRVRALFVHGAQRGRVPQARHARAVLLRRGAPRAQHRQRPAASRLSEDALAAERYLLYVTVSRPTRPARAQLARGRRRGQAARSLAVRRRRRRRARRRSRRSSAAPLGAVGWPEALAPTGREAARDAATLAPPARGAAHRAAGRPGRPRRAGRSATRGRRARSRSGAACPVQVVRRAAAAPRAARPRPRADAPRRPGPPRPGADLRGLGGALTEANLPRRARGCTPRWPSKSRVSSISVNPERLRAQLRRLEVDLLAYLEQCRARATSFAPDGLRGSLRRRRGRPPAARAGDGELRLQGQIDRIDRRGDEAIVVDYKGKPARPAASSGSRTASCRSASTCSRSASVLGLEPVGGFYQPLGADDPRAARRAARRRRPRAPTSCAADRIEADELDELLAGCAAARARRSPRSAPARCARARELRLDGRLRRTRRSAAACTT